MRSPARRAGPMARPTLFVTGSCPGGPDDRALERDETHRRCRRHTALIVVAALAGPVQAGPAAWLTSPTPSRTVIAAGGSVSITITNTDRRTASSALSVTLAKNPSSAPFAIVSNLCAGVALPPGGSCTVDVAYLGPTPNADHTAALTVASGKPMKASVTRFIEVGVTFADVCVAHGGLAGYGGTIMSSDSVTWVNGATGTRAGHRAVQRNVRCLGRRVLRPRQGNDRLHRDRCGWKISATTPGRLRPSANGSRDVPPMGGGSHPAASMARAGSPGACRSPTRSPSATISALRRRDPQVCPACSPTG